MIMRRPERITRRALRSPQLRRPIVIGLVCVVLSGVWLCVHRSTSSLERSVTAGTAALSRMQSDADAIIRMQQAPKRAVDEVRANEELLSQIDQALSIARVPKDTWRDSVPQTPRRDADGQFVIYTTRLYFEGMELRQMVALAHALLDNDPILSISALQLTANDRVKGRDAVWNVEIAVTYRLYAPQV